MCEGFGRYYIPKLTFPIQSFCFALPFNGYMKKEALQQIGFFGKYTLAFFKKKVVTLVNIILHF